jgi:hypothetical protein
MLIFTAAAMKYARGPYYICSDTDNDYLYLVSSLAMAESKQVFFTDHPGTTLQILGAVSLKISHALDFSEKDSLEFAVLKNPEFYLKVINIVLVSLNVLILFVIGLVTFNLTKNIGLALLLQYSPFFSNITLRWGLNNISCEPLLLFTSMLFVLILVKMVVDANIYKSAHWYMVVFSLISGFGIATKVTFAPLLIIPLIALPKFRNKIGFLLLTGVSAIVWTWPIHSQYERILHFFYITLTNTHWYGYGPSGIDTASIKINLLNMLTGLLYNPLNILFLLTPFLIIIIFIWSAAKRKIVWQDTSFKVLLAVMVSQLFSSLIVIKQNAERYALPALSLIGFLLFLQLIFLQRRDYFRHLDARKVTFFIVIFLVFSGVWGFYGFKDTFNELLLIKNESLSYYQKAENEYKEYLKIFVNLQPRSIAPSPVAGLSYGNNMASHKYSHLSEISEGEYSKGLYSETLQKIYGETCFYNLCSGEFYTWTKSFFIEDIIIKKQITKIIFYGPPDFRKKKDVLIACRTGSVLHLKNVSDGIYDNIYTLEGIAIKAVNFEECRFHCY